MSDGRRLECSEFHADDGSWGPWLGAMFPAVEEFLLVLPALAEVTVQAPTSSHRYRLVDVEHRLTRAVAAHDNTNSVAGCSCGALFYEFPLHDAVMAWAEHAGLKK